MATTRDEFEKAMKHGDLSMIASYLDTDHVRAHVGGIDAHIIMHTPDNASLIVATSLMMVTAHKSTTHPTTSIGSHWHVAVLHDVGRPSARLLGREWCVRGRRDLKRSSFSGNIHVVPRLLAYGVDVGNHNFGEPLYSAVAKEKRFEMVDDGSHETSQRHES